MELRTTAAEALRSRLTLQQAERDGGTKTTAMAVFVPRCVSQLRGCCHFHGHVEGSIGCDLPSLFIVA